MTSSLNISHRFTPELADEAAQATALLIEALSRKFPYQWPTDINTSQLIREEEPLTQFAGEHGGRLLYPQAQRWFATKVAGEPPEVVVTLLRSFLPLFIGAEQLDVGAVYVTTIVGSVPSLHMILNFFLSTVWLTDADHEVEGTWAKSFHDAFEAAERVHVKFIKTKRYGFRGDEDDGVNADK